MRGCIIAALVALVGCGASASQRTASSEPVAEPARGAERAERVEESAPAPVAAPPAPTVAAPPAPTVAAPPPPTPPPPPAPRVNFPRYTEVQAYLRQSARGQRCFQNNVISADLTETSVDGDFNGDGAQERVLQTPDCLVVVVQQGERWEVGAIAPRPVGRDVEAVRLRAVAGPGGRALIESVDLQGTQRTTSRWRFSGTAIESAP